MTSNITIYDPNKQIVDLNTYSLKNINKEITVSTITIVCKLNMDVDIQNVFLYIQLNKESIQSVIYNTQQRSLYKKENVDTDNITNKRLKKKKGNFYNQVTLHISTFNNRILNVKLSRNGAIQMTGCKMIEECNDVLNKLIQNLLTIKAIYENNQFKDIYFVTKNISSKTDDISINDFKIAMINSNFSIGYSINRELLYKNLKQDGVSCTYEPQIHAGVDIKYTVNDKVVSIFIFQTGCIIITGAQNAIHIDESHKYVTNLLSKHKNDVIKEDIEKLDDMSMLKYFNINKEDINELTNINELIKKNIKKMI